MGGGPKQLPNYTPAPAPVPKASDAAAGADQMAADQRRQRRSLAGSFLTPTMSQTTPGKQFLG